MNYIVTITAEEEKALLTDIISIQDWIDNAIHNKARQVIDVIMIEYTDKQPNKMTKEDKYKVIRETELKTAQEKNDEPVNK